MIFALYKIYLDHVIKLVVEHSNFEDFKIIFFFLNVSFICPGSLLVFDAQNSKVLNIIFFFYVANEGCDV